MVQYAFAVSFAHSFYVLTFNMLFCIASLIHVNVYVSSYSLLAYLGPCLSCVCVTEPLPYGSGEIITSLAVGKPTKNTIHRKKRE